MNDCISAVLICNCNIVITCRVFKILQHTQNWVTSSQPVGTEIKAETGDAPQVSAGMVNFILLHKNMVGPDCSHRLRILGPQILTT